MNLFDLSTVICTCTVEVAKDNICPLDVDVCISDSDDFVFKVDNVELYKSKDSGKYILVLSNND